MIVYRVINERKGPIENVEYILNGAKGNIFHITCVSDRLNGRIMRQCTVVESNDGIESFVKGKTLENILFDLFKKEISKYLPQSVF